MCFLKGESDVACLSDKRNRLNEMTSLPVFSRLAVGVPPLAFANRASKDIEKTASPACCRSGPSPVSLNGFLLMFTSPALSLGIPDLIISSYAPAVHSGVVLSSV
jgi:hypothetical protein